MSRTMYDAVDAFKIPTNANMVAGYVDGLYAWSNAGWNRFPNAVKLTIAIRATTVANILDIEQGNDMNPADWVSWVQLVRSHSITPIAYMNTSTWPVVREAFRSRGVPEPLYWVAQYDNVASIPSGALAKQYYNNNDLGYDLSVVADYIPGVDHVKPAPAPPIPVFLMEDDDMQQIEPLSVHPGEYAYPIVSKKAFRLVADGYGKKASFRVVVWNGTAADIHQNVQVGGGFVDIPLTATTSAVTVRRLDSESFPVGTGAY